jgi:aryl-alcohol dehydrogenase-like predicted oxidoreductase
VTVVPIPGTKRRRYLEEDVAAIEVELTATEIDDIESVFRSGRSPASATPTCPASASEPLR